MTWAQLIILCMVETGGPVTSAIVRTWIRNKCPSRYERSSSVAAVFHSTTHNNKSWAMVERGCYRLVKPPQNVQGLYDALRAYNTYMYRKAHLGREGAALHSGLPTPSPASLSVTTTQSHALRSPQPSLHSPTLPPSPYSLLSPLPSVSSPSPVHDEARPPGASGHPDVVGATHGPNRTDRVVSTRALAKPPVLSKELIDESRLAWLMEKKSRKRAIASPEDYRQSIEKSLAFIMSLAS
jgi:hypothetical protein